MDLGFRIRGSGFECPWFRIEGSGPWDQSYHCPGIAAWSLLLAPVENPLHALLIPETSFATSKMQSRSSSR